MELIQGEHLSYHNGNKEILKDGQFRILEGTSCGLIGPNGAGKTTLIRLILGQEIPDRGNLYVQPGLSIGYVPQNQEQTSCSSVGEFITAEADAVYERMRRLEERMAEGGEDTIELMADYEGAVQDFEQHGGYGAMEKGEQLLRRLGLDSSMDQEMGTLSGGERSLVFFAKALLSDPKLLILDEPGNHLDYLGLAWLEAFLQHYEGTVLVVSHNRYLLDAVCKELLHIEGGVLTSFTGNYSRYKAEVLRNAVVMKNAFEASRRRQAELAKKINQLQSIAMSQYNPPARVMNQLAAAKRKYQDEVSRDLHRPDVAGNPISLEIAGEASRSDIALRVEGFTLSYGEKELLRSVSLEIACGERVALVGPNGSGKSSFLNALVGRGGWDHPQLKIGPGQKIGYLSQVPAFNREARTVEDEVRSWGALTKEAGFSLIQGMGFSYEDMGKSLSVLSGGETSRLQLARFTYQKVNFLILDEPTNHMDIESREAIEESVSAFKGTILVVSHDRYFLDTLVDRVVEIREKAFVSYPGNFSRFFHARYPVLPRLKGDVKRRGGERTSYQSGENSVTSIERRIEAAETETKALEKELKRCLEANDMKAGHAVSVRHEKVLKLLDKLYAEWEASM
ncbi:MAG: ABC-F family ATP-binding cassette domain-containing protein [Spirochaetales bacterium]|nr:ABC-F family ATP-binding cassette domain-containing protein [Spirochaetales bacterium]